jgi:hypothetical protein
MKFLSQSERKASHSEQLVAFSAFRFGNSACVPMMDLEIGSNEMQLDKSTSLYSFIKLMLVVVRVRRAPKIIEKTIMPTIKGILFFAVATTISTWSHRVSAQFPNCIKANTAFCESPVNGLTNNSIIFRCTYDIGQASPGNCNDE